MGRVPEAGHATFAAALGANRLVVAITFIVLLIVGVVASLATDGWWAVVAACAVHAAGTLVVITVGGSRSVPAVSRCRSDL